jgi:hypothetical protein
MDNCCFSCYKVTIKLVLGLANFPTKNCFLIFLHNFVLIKLNSLKMQRYPVGIQDFSEIRKGGYIYVDKTDLAYQLINQSKYYFLSRPRRFGKSLFVSMLDYLFQGKKEYFEGLDIYEKWNWEEISPVIKISFSNIGHKSMGLEKAINKALNEIAEKYSIQFEAIEIDQKFKELIQKLSNQYGQVVILIDEYDKPIIDFLGTDDTKAIENRNIMKLFYSILKDSDPYLKLVFITGVSQFSRVSIFSDLNNLRDLTINKSFETICGISQAELESNFVEEYEEYDAVKMKKWYNGYSWGGTNQVYNPFSLLNFFVSDGQFDNYWFETGTPTFLLNLNLNNQSYDFEHIKIPSLQLRAYDIERLQLIPLMFQTGYLTIKNYNEEDDLYELSYPNEEVRRSYISLLADAYTHSYNEPIQVMATEIRNALRVADLKKVESILNSVFKSLPYEVWQKENEHFYHAIIHLTFRLLGIYVESQVQTSDGRMDALVKVNDYIYAFEFKLDESAEVALQQVKDKGYLQPYFHQNKTCIGVGINFSTATKKVEKLVWEEIK